MRVTWCSLRKQFCRQPLCMGRDEPDKRADCSGFTMSYLQKIRCQPATSRCLTGRSWERRLSMGSAQPGDLSIYAKNGSINHVAIYIGNGQVIHASSPKTGIKISTWNYRTPAVSEGIYRINFLPNSVKMVLHIPGACDILFECVVIMTHTDNN